MEHRNRKIKNPIGNVDKHEDNKYDFIYYKSDLEEIDMEKQEINKYIARIDEIITRIDEIIEECNENTNDYIDESFSNDYDPEEDYGEISLISEHEYSSELTLSDEAKSENISSDSTSILELSSDENIENSSEEEPTNRVVSDENSRKIALALNDAREYLGYPSKKYPDLE